MPAQNHAGGSGAASAVPTYGISFGSSDFTDRIKRITNAEPAPKTSRINHAILIGTAVLFLLSYIVILEPDYELPIGGFTMDASNAYYHPNEDGTYDVIYNDQYFLLPTGYSTNKYQ